MIATETARNFTELKDQQRAVFDQRVMRMAGDIGALYAGTTRAKTTDRNDVGTVITSKKIESGYADDLRARIKVIEAGRDSLPASSPNRKAVLAMHQAVLGTTNRNTRGGDEPRPQCLLFDYDASRAESVKAELEHVWKSADPFLHLKEASPAAGAGSGDTEPEKETSPPSS